MIRNTIRIISLAIVLLSSTSDAQDSTEWYDWPTGDRLRVAGGFFVPNLDTAVAVTDIDGIAGPRISFEENLGLDDSKSTILLSAEWRFLKRHLLSYNWFDLQRSAESTSPTSIAVGAEVFDVTLPIQSFFDVSAHEFAYSYSLIFDQKKDLFIGLGVSFQDLTLGIQGTESSPNPGEVIDSMLDSTAPLPTLNLGFSYAFTDSWVFTSRLGWLAVEFDVSDDEDLSGRIINAYAGVMWHAFENVAFFAQYQLFDVDVDYVDAGVGFALDYDYNGPVLGVSVGF